MMVELESVVLSFILCSNLPVAFGSDVNSHDLCAGFNIGSPVNDNGMIQVIS